MTNRREILLGLSFAGMGLSIDDISHTAFARVGTPAITLFPASEYRRRQERVLKSIEAARLDGMLVTAITHTRYLTGYSGSGANYAPFLLLLSPGRDPIFIVREFDEQSVRAEGCVEELVTYTHERDMPQVCADVLRRYGLHDERVGMELGCWNLAPSDVSALQSRLPELKIVNATKLVSQVAAIKTETEIQVMRQAAQLTDIAINTFYNSLVDGVTEREVAESIRRNVSGANGDLAWVDIVFGERLRLPHADPTNYAISGHEGAFVELSGKKNGYMSPLCRSAVLGRNPGLESLNAVASDALQAGIDIMKPGVTAGSVYAAIRGVIDRSGRPRALRHRAGYQVGSWWVDRGDIDFTPGNGDVLCANMTFHLPIILFDEDGSQIGCSETVLIRDGGSEILSSISRDIYRVS